VDGEFKNPMRRVCETTERSVYEIAGMWHTIYEHMT
jgi:hypothetical protein